MRSIAYFLSWMLLYHHVLSEKPLEWWEEAVVYQIYPRSFYDNDGDGIGDLLGIKQKVNYLEELGVKAVWLNPIYKSPMKDFGYDIQNYTDIDPIFGTLEDFKALMKELESKGINIIMDFVPNHTSDKHIWFEKSRQREDPYTNYYIWANGTGINGTELPNNWLSVFGGSAWEWCPIRKQYYLHQFLKEQPDLNYRDMDLRREIENVLRFWLDLGVKGFRIDALKFLFEDPQLRDEPFSNNPSVQPGQYEFLIHNYTVSLPEIYTVLGEWREVMNEYQKKDGRYRMMVLEIVGVPLEELLPYYGNETHPLADMPFNFDLLQITNSTSAQDVRDIIAKWIELTPAGKWMNWVLSNHDQPRLVNKTNVDLIDAFNMINLLLKGTPFTYYGEEIGMVDTEVSWEETQDPFGLRFGKERYKEFSRDPERSPMQWNSQLFSGFTQGNRTWLPVNINYKEINVEAQRLQNRSHLQTYKRLVNLRKKKVFKYGSVEFPYVTEHIFSFTRIYKGEPGYIILVNFGVATEILNLTTDAKSSNFKFPLHGNVVANSANIPDYSPLARLYEEVDFSHLVLGSYQAVVISFMPVHIDRT